LPRPKEKKKNLTQYSEESEESFYSIAHDTWKKAQKEQALFPNWDLQDNLYHEASNRGLEKEEFSSYGIKFAEKKKLDFSGSLIDFSGAPIDIHELHDYESAIQTPTNSGNEQHGDVTDYEAGQSEDVGEFDEIRASSTPNDEEMPTQEEEQSKEKTKSNILTDEGEKSEGDQKDANTDDKVNHSKPRTTRSGRIVTPTRNPAMAYSWSSAEQTPSPSNSDKSRKTPIKSQVMNS